MIRQNTPCVNDARVVPADFQQCVLAFGHPLVAGADDVRMLVTGSRNEELSFTFKIPMRRRMPGTTLLSPILYDLVLLFWREIAVVLCRDNLRTRALGRCASISLMSSWAFGGFILIFISHLDYQFTLVRPFEEFIHRARGFLQTFDDVHAVFEFAFHIPLDQFGDGFLGLGQVIEHDEALHFRAAGQDVDQIVRTGDGRRGVILRDHSADADPRALVEHGQRGVEDFSADVVEVDVYAIRTGPLQPLANVLGLVIDRGVEAQIVHDPFAFLVASGDADDAAALDLADLADDRADRAGGGGYDERFARLRISDVQQSEVGRQSDDAK